MATLTNNSPRSGGLRETLRASNQQQLCIRPVRKATGVVLRVYMATINMLYRRYCSRFGWSEIGSEPGSENIKYSR